MLFSCVLYDDLNRLKFSENSILVQYVDDLGVGMFDIRGSLQAGHCGVVNGTRGEGT